MIGPSGEVKRSRYLCGLEAAEMQHHSPQRTQRRTKEEQVCFDPLWFFVTSVVGPYSVGRRTYGAGLEVRRCAILNSPRSG